MYKLRFKLFTGEYLFGGATHVGVKMPLSSTSRVKIDLTKSGYGNQSAPLFVSTKGRYVWSETPFCLTARNGVITCVGNSEIRLVQCGSTLKDAYLNACKNLFAPNGKVPNADFFTKPQYNTWVELLHNHTQQGVLNYAQSYVDNGFATGVLMIDDTWQSDYGVWEFDEKAFPSPKQMIDDLHNMGYKVMLWIVPYVTTKNADYTAQLVQSNCLLMSNDKPTPIKWWNGISNVYDLRNESARKYLAKQLDNLVTNYGVDGFKFDGGQIDGLIKNGVSSDEAVQINQAWFTFAERYPYNEAKDTCGLQQLSLVQRLRDKMHSWRINGLNAVIPDALNASMLGYRYLCPDMIGGGEWRCFTKGKKIDQQLFVRYAECSALFPMMQFSLNPTRVLNKKNLQSVLNLTKLHQRYSDYICNLVNKSAISGEPVIRPLCYCDPDCHYEKVTDQFMFGENIVVAPILRPNTTKRKVRLPQGTWRYDGTTYLGRTTVTVTAPLGKLIYFEKVPE